MNEDWFKSSRSQGSSGCVEARLGGDSAQVRDSKDRSGPVLTFSASAWMAFLDDVKEGRYDLDA